MDMFLHMLHNENMRLKMNNKEPCVLLVNSDWLIPGRF